MANKQLLSEAIEAFINRDEAGASKKLRAFFVESAQEINKQMEEGFDAEAEGSEEAIQEDLNADPNQGLTDGVGYKLDEKDEGEEADDAEADAMFAQDETADAEEDAVDAVQDEVAADEVADEAPVSIDSDDWAEIKNAFSSLEAMFSDIEAGEGVEAEDEAEEAGDDFEGVDFGDEKIGESFKLKEVPAVDKNEKAGVQKKSPVPTGAKPSINGAKPATSVASGTPNDKTFDNKEHEPVKVDDRGNVIKSDKDVQKPAKAPKNAPVSAKSPVPTKK